jgi:hypothetical protein
MANTLLMPKATAVWLVDNTALSFEQIAQFCSLHPLEVKAIADGEAALRASRAWTPISTGQLSREEIARRRRRTPTHRLHMSDTRVRVPESPSAAPPRYTPLSKPPGPARTRSCGCCAITPSSRTRRSSRLVGTTKSTIESDPRTRRHWNANNLAPMDPVTLGLCSQIDLDFEVQRASAGKPAPAPSGETLLPASMTERLTPSLEKEKEEDKELDADAVFAKLSALKKKDDEEEE